jgi:NADPH:quinone reductase-like Zn-dependent oxidoreductase/acyl carrier protein
MAELTEPGAEQQVALREPGRRVARLARAHSSTSSLGEAGDQEPWQLVPAETGTLDDFRRQPTTRRPPGTGEVEIAVEATGLNFKDVLSALGMYPGEAGPLGGECAGRVVAVGPGVTSFKSGDAVLAVAAGSFASHVTAKSELVRRLPPGISVEEGSSFPIAFLTAEYCLSYLAHVQSGDRVLIHAAAGGVGMAAVRLAQRAGAEVFATAGSSRKRELLRSIGVKHVFDSRSTDFAGKLLDLTDGRGVDIVLNSLSGEQIDASFRVIARGGRFVEIGKRGIKSTEWVTALNRDLRYFVVDWGETAAKEPALIGEMLGRLVDELGRGTLAPLPHHVFCLDDIDRAFRFMAQARHVGKIVVRHGRRTTPSLRREGTYLITGGLSGLGLLVAQSLAAQGAGRLVLVSRRGASADAEKIINSIKDAGSTTVVTEALDVSDEAALSELLTRIRRDGPPLRGVVHGAGVLDDAGLIQQDSTRFARVFAPKVQGGWLLDRLTRVDSLDWFVMFSSAAAVLGSAGQANHAAANAFLDVLARERSLQGLPGLSINWGAWTDVGAAADRGLTDRLAARGIGALKPSDGLLALDFLLNEDYAQVAVVPVDWRRYLDSSNRGYSLLTDVGKATATERKRTSSNRPPDVDFREQLANAPTARRPAIVSNLVREHALRALGLDPARLIDPRTPLGELGLDSLLSVELRNALRSAIGVPLPATLLFDFPTIAALTAYLLSVLSPEDDPKVLEPAADVPHGSLLGSIEELSDEEVDRLLAARGEKEFSHE